MIRTHVFNAHSKHKIRCRETIGVARRVLTGECRMRAEINIVFVTDKRMSVLNCEYLGRRYATDVMSFPLSDADAKTLEGEVYVNLDQARRQAREYDESFRNEVARLIIHGILHLAGYNDRTRRQKDQMTRMENLYLRRMKYIEERTEKGNG